MSTSSQTKKWPRGECTEQCLFKEAVRNLNSLCSSVPVGGITSLPKRQNGSSYVNNPDVLKGLMEGSLEIDKARAEELETVQGDIKYLSLVQLVKIRYHTLQHDVSGPTKELFLQTVDANLTRKLASDVFPDVDKKQARKLKNLGCDLIHILGHANLLDKWAKENCLKREVPRRWLTRGQDQKGLTHGMVLNVDTLERETIFPGQPWIGDRSVMVVSRHSRCEASHIYISWLLYSIDPTDFDMGSVLDKLDNYEQSAKELPALFHPIDIETELSEVKEDIQSIIAKADCPTPSLFPPDTMFQINTVSTRSAVETVDTALVITAVRTSCTGVLRALPTIAGSVQGDAITAVSVCATEADKSPASSGPPARTKSKSKRKKKSNSTTNAPIDVNDLKVGTSKSIAEGTRILDWPETSLESRRLRGITAQKTNATPIAEIVAKQVTCSSDVQTVIETIEDNTIKAETIVEDCQKDKDRVEENLKAETIVEDGQKDKDRVEENLKATAEDIVQANSKPTKAEVQDALENGATQKIETEPDKMQEVPPKMEVPPAQMQIDTPPQKLQEPRPQQNHPPKKKCCGLC